METAYSIYSQLPSVSGSRYSIHNLRKHHEVVTRNHWLRIGTGGGRMWMWHSGWSYLLHCTFLWRFIKSSLCFKWPIPMPFGVKLKYITAILFTKLLFVLIINKFYFFLWCLSDMLYIIIFLPCCFCCSILLQCRILFTFIPVNNSLQPHVRIPSCSQWCGPLLNIFVRVYEYGWVVRQWIGPLRNKSHG